MVYLVERERAGQAPPRGEDILKGGTDFHNRLISDRCHDIDVPLENDREKFLYFSVVGKFQAWNLLLLNEKGKLW